MTGCTITGCGTGTGNLPQPGDPNTSGILLTCAAAYGGIDVTWTYPVVNPEAVAYTIIYRSTSALFLSAGQLVIATGNFFYDKTPTANESAVTYFYWIQIVSVNGTVSEVIGPSFSVAMPPIAQVIANLSGQINASHLAKSLSARVDKIEINEQDIITEADERKLNDGSLGTQFNAIQAYSVGSRALITQETTARTTSDSAITTQVAQSYSTASNSISAIEHAQSTTSTAVSSLSTDVTTLNSTVYGNTAAAQVGLTTKVTVLDGKVTSIGAQYTAKLDVNGYVGGFGVYNTGATVDAGFNVDTFWVGKASTKIKPFIISGSKVYIDQAVINTLTFTKLRDETGGFVVADGKIKASHIDIDLAYVHGAMQSSTYIPNYRGWKLDVAGTVENNGAVAGEGRTVQTSTTISVYDAAGTLRVQLGKLGV